MFQSICSKYFNLFQTYVALLFYLDIAKVDLDVAYTCTLQVYIFKCFQMFHTYVCKYFI
jgi:hypothetical protein